MKKYFVIPALFAAIACCANASLALASQNELIEACKQKDFKKCAELTSTLMDNLDYDNALKYAKMACDLGDGASCASAGDILAYESDDNSDKVLKDAQAYYLKACDLKSGAGCNAVGKNYEQGIGVGQNYAKAAQYFKQACDLKDPQGCFNMGRMY